MRRFLLGIFLGIVLTVGVARGASYVRTATTDPPISLTPEALLSFWSAQAGARGVTTDAQWTTAMGSIFSAANFPGVDPTALAFLRSFFVQFVHVGVP